MLCIGFTFVLESIASSVNENNEIEKDWMMSLEEVAPTETKWTMFLDKGAPIRGI